MGICNSCEATHVATAKVILQDGQLREFSYPVKVSYVLQKIMSPESAKKHFICNADDMDFDGVVSATNEEHELQVGQLYFVLPVSRLKRSLPAEEMAALAVKASSALMKSVGACCEKYGHRQKAVAPVVVPGERRVASGGHGRREFTPLLSAIAE